MSKTIDPAAIDQIRELQSVSDPNVLANLVRLFLSGLPARMTAIQTAVGTGNASKLRNEAHSLKSSAANMGAIQMSEFCRQLEEMGIKGIIETAAPIFTQLEKEVALVFLELESLPELKTPSYKKSA